MAFFRRFACLAKRPMLDKSGLVSVVWGAGSSVGLLRSGLKRRLDGEKLDEEERLTYFKMIVRFFGLAMLCVGDGTTNFSNDMPKLSSTLSDLKVRSSESPRFYLITMIRLRSLLVSSPS